LEELRSDAPRRRRLLWFLVLPLAFDFGTISSKFCAERQVRQIRMAF
jgi:hypothetical protein